MQDYCLNCGEPYEKNFCPECGQKVRTHRVTFKTIMHEIPHSFFHLDRGFFFTFKQLLIRPGRAISEYLAGKRVNYFSPFAYLVLLCTISTLITHEGAVYYTAHNGHITDLSRYMLFPKLAVFFAHYPALMYCGLIPFISIWSWLFNLNTRYNYWENFVLNTYLVAQINILLIFFQVCVAFNILGTKLTPVFVVFFIYFAAAYFRFFAQPLTILNVIRNSFMILMIVLTFLTGLTVAGFMTPWWI